MTQYRFSGHESFHCKHFWLKKGFDFVFEDNKNISDQEIDFKSKEAVISLGVGKNMVASISHWLKVFGLASNDATLNVKKEHISELGIQLFSDSGGLDPFLEDSNTLFLLHYLALKNDYASVFRIAFNEFRKSRVSNEFTSNQLFDFLRNKLNREGVNFSEKSLKTDINVFLRTYCNSLKRNSKNIEDEFSSLFLELGLISPVSEVYFEGEQVYKMNYDSKESLAEEILLYAIIDHSNESSISFIDIQNEVSDAFLCNKEGTEKKLNLLEEKGYLVFKEDAGRKEVQFKSNLKKEDVLKKYYEQF